MIGQYCAWSAVGSGVAVKTLSFVCDHASPSTRPKARSSWYCSCDCISGSAPVHRPFKMTMACRMYPAGLNRSTLSVTPVCSQPLGSLDPAPSRVSVTEPSVSYTIATATAA